MREKGRSLSRPARPGDMARPVNAVRENGSVGGLGVTRVEVSKPFGQFFGCPRCE